MSNSFGHLFKISTFGESHGKSMGVIIDGCPAGIPFEEELIRKDLDRRKPGQSKITTQRQEDEDIEIHSGVFEGVTIGTPIGITIRNKDPKSKDYSHIADTFRPSHADYTYQMKYGVRDYRGGGRSSARETVNWVIGGAIAKMILSSLGVKIQAYVSAVGELELETDYKLLNLDTAENNIVRCPDTNKAEEMIDYISQVKKNGDTVGGKISCVVQNTPTGLGEPVFNKLHAALGHAMLSINAVKGFEYGSGFSGSRMKGSQHNDIIVKEENSIKTSTNYSGGIQGGISNGEDIYFNVAFKPVATIMKGQESVDVKGNKTTVEGKGRHDPCVVPRAVPIVEALTALVLTDFVLLSQSAKLDASSNQI
jgi:chorismate synthase